MSQLAILNTTHRMFCGVPVGIILFYIKVFYLIPW